MITDRSHGHEQQLITRVLAAIEERLEVAKRVTATQLRDETFTKQRFAEMAEDLQTAHEVIQQQSQTIRALLNPPPDVVVAALRARPGHLQPVRWRLGGKMRTFLVPGRGYADIIGEARWWERLNEQYGEASL